MTHLPNRVYLHRKKINKRFPKNPRHFVDRLVLIMSVVTPLMTVPQVLQVWVDRQVAGLSLATWGTYAFSSLLWLIYGVKHKDKPIVLVNGLMLVCNFLVTVGVIFWQ
ncbi:hypothetical protein A3F03_02505 [Candidatus Roizmanbacteria bacterium RIFCSPHIGHO2_12_FULL_41_11]|uniref:MtN3 and saliva related transmembrane protein n=1 Tax=Candidatus Roizmanbacteria bacterium RIFCSPHIGHO2_12_FULL_41_11 TaxID=1802052 RepID=A0A1F7I3Y8_9BACT|nr:MAG: hypothetical protein A3F03_02505 [Candidatus Roizmanbacteria bacterium RIFCSPHIGHO2_12_FULL_41_11]